jgi:hypothetical protein
MRTVINNSGYAHEQLSLAWMRTPFSGTRRTKCETTLAVVPQNAINGQNQQCNSLDPHLRTSQVGRSAHRKRRVTVGPSSDDRPQLAGSNLFLGLAVSIIVTLGLKQPKPEDTNDHRWRS